MMDPKASAKAKRSFSQQGRRNHPSPASIALKKKAIHDSDAKKVHGAQSLRLPSNFDRYDDDDDKAESSSDAKLEEGEILPKSNGADFAYLIEQARSQQNEIRASPVSESAFFFDDLAADFMKGANSISTVRRKNRLSRCEDDNFVVDDDLTSSFEIPFLNLDFHAIAAQLSKLKLSERLFIEEDLLPEDLRSDDSKDTSSSIQSEKLEAIEILEAPDSYLYSSPAKYVLGHADDRNTSTSNFPNPNISQAYPAQENHQETTISVTLGQQYDKREAKESPANIRKSSKIGEAEAELDMLLESFKETSLSSSIQDDPLDNKPTSNISLDESMPFDFKSAAQNPDYYIRKLPADADLDILLDSSEQNSLSGSKSDLFYPMHQQFSNQSQFSSKNTVTASIDDSIDDLLAETSSILEMQRSMKAPAAAPQLGSMFSTTGNSIDDLSGGRKSLVTQNGVKSSIVFSSNLGSEVQNDDFDSWMDSF